MSDDRVILALTGPDRTGFLQDLVSNDITRPGLVWSALLTPQGKYLADFFTWDDGERLLLDVAAPLAQGLAQRLSMYKLRRKLEIAATGLKVRRGTGPAPEGAMADPRHPAMGWRLYGENAGDDGSDWDAIRVQHLVPETGIELIPNETFILEAGLDRLNGVDFRKGCYVGQEVTARMHHKTELKKGLMRVRIEGPAQPGDEIATEEGKPAGRLHTRAGDRAIAWLRFDRATGPMMAGATRIAADAAPEG